MDYCCPDRSNPRIVDQMAVAAARVCWERAKVADGVERTRVLETAQELGMRARGIS